MLAVTVIIDVMVLGPQVVHALQEDVSVAGRAASSEVVGVMVADIDVGDEVAGSAASSEVDVVDMVSGHSVSVVVAIMGTKDIDAVSVTVYT